MMRRSERIRSYTEVGVETLRIPTRNATGEEDAGPDDAANDDGTLKSSERISLDGNASHQPSVNLCCKKRVLKIGTWNVRTLNQSGKFELLLDELERLHLDIIGLCETRWKGEGLFNPDKTTTVVYSGKESGKSESGVAIVLKGEARKSLDAYTPISDRIVTARLNAKPKPLTVIQVYAPTSTQDECTKDQFYDQLQATVDKVNKGDICIVMGDLNAKVGEGQDTKCGIGRFGLGKRNESGDKLAEFCHANNYTTLHKYTI